jgi:serine/threonine protein kinase
VTGSDPGSTFPQPEPSPRPADRPADDTEEPVDAPPGYALGVRLGRGGQAQVWSGRDLTRDVPVALKFWPRTVSRRDRDRLDREIGVLRQLTGHPNIVRFLDARIVDGARPWLATELCEDSLGDRLRSGSISTEQAFTWAEDMLTGLAYVHQKGLLHRDVKPANVLIHHGRAKLCDLGLAGDIDGHTSVPQAGTAYYIAPELGEHQPSVRSDLYSAGRTLEALFRQVADPPPGLAGLLTRATSSRPGDRPADAGELRRQLMALKGGVTAVTVPDPPARRRGIRAAIAVTVALVLIVAGVLTGRALLNGRGTPHPSPTVAVHEVQQIQSLYASRCVDVYGPFTEDATPTQLWDCINVPEERWHWDGARLRGFGDKCVGAADASAVDGIAVQLLTCADDPRQTWRLTAAGELRVLGDRCLAVRGQGYTSGTRLEIDSCDGSSEQAWRFY